MTTIPSYDFYQTPTHLTLSVYVKGYAAEGVKDQVDVKLDESSITMSLPALSNGAVGAAAGARSFTLGPLYSTIVPGESTTRVLNTKIEVKLAKASPINWQTLLADPSRPAPSQYAQASTSQLPSASTPTATSGSTPAVPSSAPAPGPSSDGAKYRPKTSTRKNWDRLVDDELADKEDEAKDPNAGGDVALQSFFNQIYANADEDTKRAMIKSFTESGGTSLSTDWNTIGKGTTPTRPPEGMEQRKYEH
ncbi:hypothetical protein I317_00826 [Kwoniella heveanensis CBS 569]|nr:hypothetical protein I317_00826 [Kwoniella heveanensis CBS 569]